MEQKVQFEIKGTDGKEKVILTYLPKNHGFIEIKRLTDNLNVLIIHFQELKLVSEAHSNHVDELLDKDIEIMLTNYPIAVSNLKELDNLKIEVKEGWTDNLQFTMVAFRDGEPINNNVVAINRNERGELDICWTGSLSKWQRDHSDRFMKLNIKALPKRGIITPLCESFDAVIEKINEME